MLLTKLPRTLLNKPVNTDFRFWMRQGVILEKLDLMEIEKMRLVVFNVFGEVPEDADFLYEECLWFYRCGTPLREIPPRPYQEQQLCWERDSAAIWGDFKVHVHMDLDYRKKLHWWEFRAMFDSLPEESTIKRTMYIRGIDPSEVKGNTPEAMRERENIMRQKAMVSLEELNPYEELDMALQRSVANGR